jgi:hypothetical protein
MGIDVVERDDITVYLVAGVPKSFKRKLQKFVQQEAKEAGDIYMLEEELSDWVIAKVRNDKRGGRDRTPATAALWRAFSALSAARYHLQHSPESEERVRELRSQVEEIWRELSPMFNDDDGGTGSSEAKSDDEQA